MNFHDRELIFEALNVLRMKTTILVAFIIVTPAKGMGLLHSTSKV